MSQAVTGDVFQYQYAYNGEHHWMNLRGIDGAAYGANHADDLFSLFRPFTGHGEEMRTPPLTDEDEEVFLRHVDMLVRFAEADGGPEAMKEEFGWDPVTECDHRYLRIDTDLTMEASDYYKERVAFWKAHE